MAFEIVPKQTRTAEPKSVIKSVGIRSVIAGLTQGENAIIAWLNPNKLELDGSAIKIYPFIAIVDKTAILIGDLDKPNSAVETINLLDENQVNYLYLQYKWTGDPETQEPAKLILDTKPNSNALLIAFYNPDSKTLHITKSFFEYLESLADISFIKTPSLSVSYEYNHKVAILLASEYETSDIFDGKHTSTTWQFCKNEDFSSDVITLVSSKYLTQLECVDVDELEPSTTYYARCKFHSLMFESRWSNTVSFHTPEPVIIPPKIVEVHYKNTLRPRFFITDFRTYKLEDTWKSTKWEISTDPNFTNIIYQHEETDEQLKQTFRVPDGTFSLSQTYYVRAKYVGNTHESDWSDTYTFITPDSCIDVPEIRILTPGSVYPKFEADPFKACNVSDKLSYALWEIATDQSFSNVIFTKYIPSNNEYSKLHIDLDVLKPFSKYFIRVNYVTDSGKIVSSDKQEFETLGYQVDDVFPESMQESIEYILLITHDGGHTFPPSYNIELIDTDWLEISKIDDKVLRVSMKVNVTKSDTYTLKLRIVDEVGNVVSEIFEKSIYVSDEIIDSDIHTSVVFNLGD